MAERPLLTLAICCYKFERFIDEALEGAFAQTYRPLEIVVSDDFSPDESWNRILDNVSRRISNVQIDRSLDIQEIHLSPDFVVILNHNQRNLGLALHENRLFELSHGEWIAFQSGDDVSVPNRMDRVSEMVMENPQIRCIECRARAVDEHGKVYKIPKAFVRDQVNRNKRISKDLPSILGAGAVYHKDVYSRFGPLGTHVKNEDHVLPLRAALLGDIVRTDDILVLYRKHGSNQSGAYQVTTASIADYRYKVLYSYFQELTDLHYAEVTSLAPMKRIDGLRSLVVRNIWYCRFLADWGMRKKSRVELLWRLVSTPKIWLYFLVKGVEKILKRF